MKRTQPAEPCPQPRCLGPNSHNLTMCYLVWQKYFADMVKLGFGEGDVILDCLVGACDHKGPYQG